MRIVPALIATATLLLVASPATAQNAATRKWTFEIYGGGSTASASSKGSGIEGFEPGTPFTAESGQQSRAVSSWYFGDGALLLNQALTVLANADGITLPRITPLDAALRAPGGTPPRGGLFGVRLGKALSPRLALEFSLEKSLGGAQISDNLKAALQTTSESFEAAFSGLLATAPIPANTIAVDSTLTLSDASTSNIRISGAARWMLFDGNRLDAFVTGGGGTLLSSGDGAEAILNGRYTFRYFGLFPMNETDRVVITVTPKKTSLFGLVGGSVTYDLSSRTGIRADVQLQLTQSGDVTSLTASPLITVGTPTEVMTSLLAPSLQFSTRTNIRSSLSGPSQNLELFKSSGLARRMSFTLGVFKRF